MTEPATPAFPEPIAAWNARSRGERLDRLVQAPLDMARLLARRSSTILRMRPGGDDWAGVEVIGHLRDLEELTVMRFRMMLRMFDPLLPASGMPEDPVAWGLIEEGAWLFDPARWAHDRQYIRDDPFESTSTFADHRTRTLAFLGCLSEDQWTRGSIHPRFGRVDFDDWTAILAWHDDNHLAQLATVLEAVAPGG